MDVIPGSTNRVCLCSEILDDSSDVRPEARQEGIRNDRAAVFGAEDDVNTVTEESAM